MAERTISRDEADATCLRNAALVLQARSRRRTFALRVIIKVLRTVADDIQAGGGTRG